MKACFSERVLREFLAFVLVFRSLKNQCLQNDSLQGHSQGGQQIKLTVAHIQKEYVKPAKLLRQQQQIYLSRL